MRCILAKKRAIVAHYSAISATFLISRPANFARHPLKYEQQQNTSNSAKRPPPPAYRIFGQRFQGSVPNQAFPISTVIPAPAEIRAFPISTAIPNICRHPQHLPSSPTSAVIPHIYRHSGESRNPGVPYPPSFPNIYRHPPYLPSFRRKPESRRFPIRRHPPYLPSSPLSTVIPAKAGIQRHP